MAVSTDSGLTVTSWVRAWKGHGQIADGYAVEGPQLALSSEVKFEDYVRPPPLLPPCQLRNSHVSEEIASWRASRPQCYRHQIELKASRWPSMHLRDQHRVYPTRQFETPPREVR